MNRARTYHCTRMRHCIEQSNGLVPSLLCPSWVDCIIATRGYDFRKGQVSAGVTKLQKIKRLYENKQHRNPKRKAFVDVPCYSFSPEHAANDASRGDCRLWRAPNERDVASNVDISANLDHDTNGPRARSSSSFRRRATTV